MLSIFRGITAKCSPGVSIFNKLPSIQTQFHTNAVLFKDEKQKRFLAYNDKIYPPQSPDEAPRPAVSSNKSLVQFWIEFRNFISIVAFLDAVCLPSKGEPQIQSRQDVVHCMHGARFDHRWSHPPNAIRVEKRRPVRSWGTVGSSRNGRQGTQCRIQKQFVGWYVRQQSHLMSKKESNRIFSKCFSWIVC